MIIKRIVMEVFLLGISFTLLTGCATTEVGENFNGQFIETKNNTPVAHIHADCYGYYLFNCIPLITGDPENPPYGFKIFKNTVKVKPVIKLLTKASKNLGATRITDIKTNIENTGAYSFWIFWYKDIQASGNAVK